MLKKILITSLTSSLLMANCNLLKENIINNEIEKYEIGLYLDKENIKFKKDNFMDFCNLTIFYKNKEIGSNLIYKGEYFIPRIQNVKNGEILNFYSFQKMSEINKNVIELQNKMTENFKKIKYINIEEADFFVNDKNKSSQVLIVDPLCGACINEIDKNLNENKDFGYKYVALYTHKNSYLISWYLSKIPIENQIRFWRNIKKDLNSYSINRNDLNNNFIKLNSIKNDAEIMKILNSMTNKKIDFNQNDFLIYKNKKILPFMKKYLIHFTPTSFEIKK